MPKTAADLTVKVGADTAGFEQGMGKVDSSLNKTRAGMGGATAALAGGAGLIAGGFAFAANSAMNFEGAMADVDASLLPTTQQLKDLQGVALQIGQETTFNATEGAKAIEELGLAGISIPDIMNGGAMAVAQLASATGEDLPASATTMANAMTVFGISGDKAGLVADTMTAALNESSLTLTDFAQGMASAGVMADSVGMSFEQTSGALALFSANGMSGADAGTALRSMLSHMAAPTAEAATLFDQLGFSLQEGIDSGDLMGYTAEKLSTGLAHMGEAERMAALNTMFGADAQRVANILYGEGAEGVAEMTAKMAANGQAQESARRRMGGLRGAVESMTGSIETAAIVIGSGLTPFLTILAEKLGDAVNWFSSLPEPMIRLVSIAAGVIGALMGLGAAFGAVMMMGGLIPGGFAAVGSAMLAILGPVALVVAAAVGLYVAFQTNFMGLRDIVTGAIDAITETFGLFGEIIRGTADSDLPRAQAAFEQLAGPLKPLALLVHELTVSFVNLYRAFAQDGLSGLFAQLPAELDRVKHAFADLGRSIIEGIGNIDWGQLVSNMGDLAGRVWDWLTDQLGRVDWAGAWDTAMGVLSNVGSWLAGKLGSAISAISTWLVEQVSGVDWPGAFQSAMSVLSAVGSWLGEKLGDAVTAIGTWLGDQLGRVDWSGIFSTALSALSSAGAWIAEAMGSAVTALGTWIKNQIEGVDWASFITTIGTRLENVITLAITGMADIFTTVLNWFTRQIEGVDWGSVGSKAAELLVMGIKGVAALAGISIWLMSRVMLALSEVDWPALGLALKDLFVAAIIGIADFMAGFGTKLWDELSAELAGVNWASLGTQIMEAFKGAVVGVGAAIGQAIWNELPGWLKTLIEGGAGALGVGQGPTTNSAGGAFGTYEPNPQGTGTDSYGQQRGWRTEYSDPYNPTEGGQGILENNEGLWLPMTTAAKDYSAALDAVALSQSSVSGTAVPLATDLTGVDTALSDIGPGFVLLSGELTKTQSSFVTFVTAVMSVMGGFAVGVPALVTAAMGGFHPPISTGTSNGKQSFIAFVTAVMSVMGGFAVGVPAITSSTMSSFRSSISSGTSTGKQSFITFVGDTIAVMGGWAGGIRTNVSNTMSTFRSTISSGTSTGKQSFITFVGDTIAVMGGWAGGMRTIVSSTMSSVSSSIRGGMAEATAAIGASASGWSGIILGAAGAMRSAGNIAGRAAGEGLVSGLSSMRGAVAAEAAALASAATSAINNALQAHSPSEVTTQSGIWAGQGLAIGIFNMRDVVERNARALAQTAVEAMRVDTTEAVRFNQQAYSSSGHFVMQPVSRELPPVIYNDYREYTVKVDDLPELSKAVDFISDLERDREQMYGGS